MSLIYNAAALKLLSAKAKKVKSQVPYRNDIHPRISDIDSITEKLYQDLEAVDNALTDNTNNLQEQITANDGDITTLNTNVTQNTNDIAANETNITTNAGDIATNTTDISTNVTNINTNETNITTNTSDIATNASDISDNQNDITTNQTNISNLQTAISNHGIQEASDINASTTNILSYGGDYENTFTDRTLVTKQYVDNEVAGGVTYKGGYDAAANTPNLDSSPTGVEIGDMYTVTSNGNFFSIPVETGDVLIAEEDGATTAAQWTVVEKNLFDTIHDTDFTTAGLMTTDGAGNYSLTDPASLATADQGSRADTAVQTETDPVFTASAAATITTSDINSWNSGLQNIVEDTTPQLGGSLDVNGNNITSGGSNAIELDASQNITLPNGNLTISGGDIQQTTSDVNYFRGNLAIGITNQSAGLGSTSGIVIAGDNTTKAHLRLDSRSEQNAFITLNHNSTGGTGDQNSLVQFQRDGDVKYMFGLNGVDQLATDGMFIIANGDSFDDDAQFVMNPNGAVGIGLGANGDPSTNHLQLGAATANKASLRITPQSAIPSTPESGQLRNDSGTPMWYDGSAWVDLSTTGTGDVVQSGIVADDQIAVWTGANTIEGDANFTWDGTDLRVTDGTNYTEIRDRYLISRSQTEDANLNLYGYGSTGSFNHNGEIALASANGTILNPTATVNTDTIGNIGFFGHTGTSSNFVEGGRLSFKASENYSGTASGTKFIIETAENGTNTLATRYEIYGDGTHNFTGKTEIVSTDSRGLDVTNTASTTTSYGIDVSLTAISSSLTTYGVFSRVNGEAGGDSYGGFFYVDRSAVNENAIGVYGKVGGSGDIGGASYGGFHYVQVSGTYSSQGIIHGSKAQVTINTSGSHGPTVYGVASDINYDKVGGTLNTAIGFYHSGAVVNTGTITSAYGIYLGDNTAGGTGTITKSYGVFQAGADDVNYFEGNVGIGTESPSVKLDIEGENAAGTFIGLKVHNETANVSGVKTQIQLPVYNGTGGGVIEEIGNSIDGYRLNIFQTQSSGEMSFGTGGDNERMRIDASGKVGIGTTDPSTELHVSGSGEMFRLETSSATGNNLMTFYSGTTQMGYLGYASSDNNNLVMLNDEASGDIQFWTTNAANATTKAMEIDLNGNVGIGADAILGSKVKIASTGELLRLESSAALGDNIISFHDAGGEKATAGFDSNNDAFEIINKNPYNASTGGGDIVFKNDAGSGVSTYFDVLTVKGDGNTKVHGNLEVEFDTYVGGQIYTQVTTFSPTGANPSISLNFSNDGAVIIIDCSGVTSGDVAITLTNAGPKAGASYLFKIIQGPNNTGIAFPATVKFAGETAPYTHATTSTNGAIDVIAMTCTSNNPTDEFLANVSQNYG